MSFQQGLSRTVSSGCFENNEIELTESTSEPAPNLSIINNRNSNIYE